MKALRMTFALALLLVGCDKKQAPQPTASSASSTAAAQPAAFDKVSRADFNRLAAEVALPLFWSVDKNKNDALDPDELAVYWGLDKTASLDAWVSKGAFTPKMAEAYDRIVAQKSPPKSDDPRRAAVRKELAQGRVTLVATDLSQASAEDKRFVAAILRSSSRIEELYAKQRAMDVLAPKVPADDPASKTLFFRGQGPKCEAPATQDDPSCGALLASDMPKGNWSGLYPMARLSDPKLCDAVTASKTLNGPFTALVEGDDKALVAKPYNEVWGPEMKAIAEELVSASDTLGDKEPALRAYLAAAARSFVDNAWWPADEAWAKMDAKNSKYYLRVAPDEVYDEPCSTKALFHVSFGLINQGSVKWQAKLDPLKAEMENALAALAGPPYKARTVSFKLPDFVDIALNAGDSRKAFGATIGQSLPNFGPVANEGRGRTVAMTNFYGDPDSLATAKDQADSLFCTDTMKSWTSEPEPQLMTTVLHEAAHNLGPAHQYKVNGKIDREAFGGPLASTLEELKAQTAALYFTDWLLEKSQIQKVDVDQAHVRDLFWAFGHVSRGMYEANKHPKNYSQLAAIQVGWLMKDGAMTWREGENAANGKDKGCFGLDLPKVPASVKSLMIEVARIKGKGDKPAAEALMKDYVDVTGARKAVHDVITARFTRAPKASFVYAVKVD